MAKNKTIGTAKGKRQYDLPLNHGSSTRFLKLLITLMSTLLVMACAGFFVLADITQRWSAGLQHQATIEIPAEDKKGQSISATDMEKHSKDIEQYLLSQAAISAVTPLSEEEIMALISPWLGDNLLIDNFPLPGILSVKFNEKLDIDLNQLEIDIQGIVPHARLDTHETWLANITKLTTALQFSAILLVLIIGITTMIAIAGAVRARMDIHRDELELLHLMGASDHYISKQFQRHSFFLSLQSSIIGCLCGLGFLFLLYLAAKQTGILSPQLGINFVHNITFIALPILMAITAMITARLTVLKVLSKMP